MIYKMLLLALSLLAAQAAVAQDGVVTPGVGKELFLLHEPGGWTVTRVTTENGRQFCTAAITDWDDNAGRPSFEIGRRDTRDLVTLIYSGGDMDYRPHRGIVSVQVDTNPPFEFEMTSAGFPDPFGVELPTIPDQFFLQLMNGRKMVISKDGQTKTFSLAGSHRALSMLAACVFDIWQDWKQRTRN